MKLLIFFQVLLVPFLFVPTTEAKTVITPKTVIESINDYRTENGLSELKENSLLNTAAQRKASALVACDCFSHNIKKDNKTITPWDFFRQSDYNYFMAGENLAKDFDDTELLVKAWIDSPGHRGNILNKNFKDTGIGIASITYANGTTRTYRVQMFGSK